MMNRLYHRERNLRLRIKYDNLKSIFGGTQRHKWVKNVLDYEDKVSIFHKNRYSYLVNIKLHCRATTRSRQCKDAWILIDIFFRYYCENL